MKLVNCYIPKSNLTNVMLVTKVVFTVVITAVSKVGMYRCSSM